MARRPKKKFKRHPVVVDATPDAAASVATMSNDDEIEILNDSLVKGIFPPVLFSNVVQGNALAALVPHNVTTLSGSNGGVTTKPNERKRKNDKENSNLMSSFCLRSHENRPTALTKSQSKLWLHKYAAEASLYPHQFPRHVFRLLGSITRRVDQQQPLDAASKFKPMKTPHQFVPRISRKNEMEAEKSLEGKPPVKKAPPLAPKMTLRRAKREALKEVEDGILKGGEKNIDARAEVILKSWLSMSDQAASVVKSSNQPSDGWCLKDGSLLNASDKSYVSIPNLLRWMETEQVVDQHAGQKCSLYHGLKNVAVDTRSILDALLDMSSPEGLYSIPLIMPYAVVTRVEYDPFHVHHTNSKHDDKLMAGATTQLWEISIGVYAHRLLPEIMSSGPLHTIMSALDTGSYRCIRKIELPPKANDVVFESCPYPIVDLEGDLPSDEEEIPAPICLDDDANDGQKEGHSTSPNERQSKAKNNDSLDDNKDDTEVATNRRSGRIMRLSNKKENIASINPGGCYFSDDARKHGQEKVSKAKSKKKNKQAFAKPTRDENRVSAFTTKGLLKLLESRGNDISNWPHLQTKILPHLKLQLMLHQVHAICWMVQMESLGGFGINSVLWETREFIDGGRYYYSPALGQIRLRPPPIMKGGLLCDEMGLGKTIEVLGLILATLDDLKQEATLSRSKNKPLTTWHATLIIVPPALVSQWLDEIQKTMGNALVVQLFDCKTSTFSNVSTNVTSAFPDVVVTTYKALEQPATARHLSSRVWGRVVLDEMQEIRQPTHKIALNCEQLECNRRWMLSGTPLFEGIHDLRGELNFLRLEPFSAALEDGFFNFAIADHWEQRNVACFETLHVLGLFLLRRSKSMTIRATGAPILGLKSLTVEFVPIPQSPSERALYCFLEHTLANELRDSSHHQRPTPRLCLRLLRELCISTTLLNGGLGVRSQLTSLQNILSDQQRRKFAPIATRVEKEPESAVYSCERAIQYISAVQEATRAGEDEVSFLQLGFGQGMSRRIRAELTSMDDQLQAAKESLAKATAENVTLKRRRAVALWHIALELVTTGHAPSMKSSKFSGIWRWRHLLARHIRLGQHDARAFPTFLCLGWRPSRHLVECELFQKHPDFAWAHPHCLELKGIPNEVDTQEVVDAIFNALGVPEPTRTQPGAGSPYGRFLLERVCNTSNFFWNAYLQFKTRDDVVRLHQMSCRMRGIPLPSVKPIPHICKTSAQAQEKVDNASSAYTIHPCATNHAALRKAKKELEHANAGLSIIGEGRHGNLHVGIASALASRRSLSPTNSQHLLSTCDEERRECNELIRRNNRTIESCQQRVSKLEAIVTKGVSREVQAMSAFEILDALARGQSETTQCPICLGFLGESTEGNVDYHGGTVALTKCGHLFCSSCLDNYIAQSGIHHNSACPSCRKPINSNEVMRVDPTKTSERDLLLQRRKEAKDIVKAAAHLLETSNGQLSPHMWEQLFLSIDQPEGLDIAMDYSLVPIPREVVGHIRAVTRMPLNCNPQACCFKLEKKRSEVLYSSRVQALLHDLPKGERSVVFSKSKASVMHLRAVLDNENIGCRALFSGQSIQESQLAVSEWKQSVASSNGERFPHPVLLVQAGAAASGLTLTAACKVFLMEPFVCYEEEQQAYARCHRYGQEKPVHVKCYYAPVSVESRLLEWRKLAEGAARFKTPNLAPSNMDALNPHIVYSLIEDSDGVEHISDSEYDDETHDANVQQTQFLMGLSVNGGLASE